MRRIALALLAGLATATAPAPAAGAEWLAGDLHVHTCFSHDVWCGPGDEPLAPDPAGAGEQAVTLGLPVAARFAEAAARGLDFLAISDHEDLRSATAPGFGAAGVLGLPAYENSLDGHAQMLGARRLYEGDAAAQAAALRADGGVLQANHPGYRATSPLTDCGDPALRHWRHGYDLRVDAVEVWNPTSPADAGEAYLECRLQRGERVAATGGSDIHWATLTPTHGTGEPTTFVLAPRRTREGVLAGLRRGRTAISRRSPVEGGAPLLLEGDADRDGRHEAVQGDRVPPGTPLRVRGASRAQTGFVRVRANGEDVALPAQGLLVPGGAVRLTAPATAGWVRATLLAVPPATVTGAPCPGRGQPASPCPYDQALLAVTSPLYVRPR